MKILANVSPVRFFKEQMSAMVFAFASASSVGTLPVNMECSKKLGVSNEVSSFVLPLGATINMDGTSIYMGVCSIFIAQVFGIDLTIGQQFTIVLTAVLASIGTAGVPGSGMIMLAMVLQSVGLPVEGIALVAGVDRILDMMRALPSTSQATRVVPCALTPWSVARPSARPRRQRRQSLRERKRSGIPNRARLPFAFGSLCASLLRFILEGRAYLKLRGLEECRTGFRSFLSPGLRIRVWGYFHRARSKTVPAPNGSG